MTSLARNWNENYTDAYKSDGIVGECTDTYINFQKNSCSFVIYVRICKDKTMAIICVSGTICIEWYDCRVV